MKGVCIFCKNTVGLRKRSRTLLKHPIWVSGYFEECPGSGGFVSTIIEQPRSTGKRILSMTDPRRQEIQEKLFPTLRYGYCAEPLDIEEARYLLTALTAAEQARDETKANAAMWKANTEAVQADNARLREALNSLANEARGFLSMADPTAHGQTNLRCLERRIDEARALLAGTADTQKER